MNDDKVSTSSKFERPAVESQRFLFRPRLIERLTKRATHRQVAVFEGQAGQGKSVLVSQYLEHLDSAYAWCRLDEKDCDSATLLISLAQACQATLLGFSCPPLESLSSVDLENETALLEAFQHSLNVCVKLNHKSQKSVHIVLDGLQVLEESNSALILLQRLIEMTPMDVTFLITSRTPVAILLSDIHTTQSWCIIDNAQLAFSRDEVISLLAQISKGASQSRAAELFRRSLGWPVGLTYLLPESRAANSAAALSDYFQRELLDGLSNDVRDFLMRVALLESISLSLVLTVSGREDAAALLQQMVEQHGFIYQRPGQAVFEMHPLLRSILRQQASAYLGRNNLKEILQRVMERLVSQKQPRQAVVYALRAGDLRSVEQLLRLMGPTLLEIVCHIEPKDVLQLLARKESNSAWLLLLQATAAMECDPAAAREPLHLALNKLRAEGDQQGELLALSLSILFHTLVSGQIEEVQNLYQRASVLYSELQHSLNHYAKAYISACLGAAQLVIHDNAELGRNSLEYALRLASEHRFERLALRIRLMRLFDLISSGQLLEAKGDMEALHGVIGETWCDALEQGYIYAAMAYWLYRSGELQELKRHLRLSKLYLSQPILEQNLAGALLLVWEMQAALAEGDFLTAKHLLQQNLGLPACGRHLAISQYLRPYHPLLDLLLDNFSAPHKKALAQLALVAKGDMHSLHALLVLGAAYLQLGDHGEAKLFLDEAHKRAELRKDYFTQSAVLLQRATLFHALGQEDLAKQDTQEFVTVMPQHNGRYSDVWIPDVAMQFYLTGIKNGVESRFLRQLAVQCLDVGVDDKGQVLPMVHVQSLGDISFTLSGESRLQQSDLTPAQRSLLSLLITAPDLCLDQASVQLMLWPDSPQEKARANFDALLSRVRSTLNKALKPWKAKSYFVLKRGVLCLSNCEVDLHHFRRQSEKGLRLYKEGKHWEAGFCLRKAVNYWQGPLCPEEQNLLVIDDLREQLNEQHAQCSRALAQLVEREGEHQEAVDLLKRFFQRDPSDESLVRRLYSLYKQLGQRDQAALVLTTYHNALIEAGTSLEDTIAMVVKTHNGSKPFTF
ncbi:MAG: BTAD domain-containing putative transcriptional regulator [Gammaproteobacteria bacterium]|nr:BTAD domain-containing putative transcriptional regulator [Gammaproteobacteria bacterium]